MTEELTCETDRDRVHRFGQRELVSIRRGFRTPNLPSNDRMSRSSHSHEYHAERSDQIELGEPWSLSNLRRY